MGMAWVREAWSAANGKVLRVRMPAGATLPVDETAISPDVAVAHLTSVVLVPDLGTAPVVRYREMLRRLVTLRERGMPADSSEDVELEIVVATPDVDSTETRGRAWQQQLDSILRRHGAVALQVRVLTWNRVADMLMRKWCPDLVSDDRPHGCAGEDGTPSTIR